VGEHIDARGEHGVHACPVLRMGEHELALRVRNVGCGLGDGGVHIHDGLGAHERARE
jgi:hypothetical protein